MTIVATLLPNAKQQFIDVNGNPLAGGSVYFYIPTTSTPKNTWQNPEGTILNTNPVILDSSGEAIIYGTGQYRQLVLDSLGNTIWDQLTHDTLPTTSTNTFHGVLALLTSNQTTTDGTDTKVSFNSTDYDTDGFWSIGTPTRVTIPSSLNGRKVIVSMNLVYDLSDVSIRVAQIFKNGTGVYPGRGSAYAGTGSPAQGTSLNCSTAAITVSTGDYFEVQATQYTGGNLDIVGSRTWIALQVIEFS